MVVPIIAYGATALAGALGGSLASSALSKGDTYAPQNTDARSYAINYPSYQIQIDSPLSSQSTTKKVASTSEPTAAAGGSNFDASSLIPIALIIGGTVVIREVIK